MPVDSPDPDVEDEILEQLFNQNACEHGNLRFACPGCLTAGAPSGARSPVAHTTFSGAGSTTRTTSAKVVCVCDLDDALVDFIGITLTSGFLAEEKPLSGLIVGPPSSSKSYTLGRFGSSTSWSRLNHFTRYGVLTHIARRAVEGKATTHIIVSDLGGLFHGAKGPSEDVQSFFLGLTDEGHEGFQSYNLRISVENLEFTQRNGSSERTQTMKGEAFPFGTIKAGVLGGITDKRFANHKSQLEDLGLLGRFIPFNFAPSLGRRSRNKDAIARRAPIVPVALPQMRYRTEVELTPDDLNQLVLFKDAPDDRAAVNARIFLCACALKNGRRKVVQADIEEVNGLTPWMQYKAGVELD